MKVASLVLGIVALVVAGYALAAWWLMLLLGAVHHDVFPQVPALGFSQSVLVVLLIAAIGGTFNATSSVSRSRNK